jgi:hypothetical protein
MTDSSLQSELVISTEEYEKYLKNAVQEQYVNWVLKNRYISGDNSSSHAGDEESSQKKQRTSNVIWTSLYYCHRAGRKQVKLSTNPGGKSGKRRPIQKSSKKVGCSAQVRVTCYRSYPNFVTIKYISEHENHIPGSLLDLQYLPLSPEIKSKIENEIELGITNRDIRLSIQRQLEREPTNDRDANIHITDIYNL